MARVNGPREFHHVAAVLDVRASKNLVMDVLFEELPGVSLRPDRRSDVAPHHRDLISHQFEEEHAPVFLHADIDPVCRKPAPLEETPDRFG